MSLFPQELLRPLPGIVRTIHEILPAGA